MIVRIIFVAAALALGGAIAWASGSDDPSPEAMASAIGLALTRSGGLLASFGGDGKSAGVSGAVLVSAGARLVATMTRPCSEARSAK